MMLTTKQSLKFVGIASKGQAKTYFEALLGDEEVPTISDFKSDDASKHEKAGCFLDCMQTIIDELVEHLRTQPRQLDLTVPESQTTNLSTSVTITEATVGTSPEEIKREAKNARRRERAAAARKEKATKKTPAKKKGKKS